MTATPEAIDALIADERLLAWENAAMLADSLNLALTGYFLRKKLPDAGHDDLDDPGWRITSDSDVVLGVRGKREAGLRRTASRKGTHVVFTYRQVMAMATTLGELLPLLAMGAREARDQWATLNGIPTHAEALDAQRKAAGG